MFAPFAIFAVDDVFFALCMKAFLNQTPDLDVVARMDGRMVVTNFKFFLVMPPTVAKRVDVVSVLDIFVLTKNGMHIVPWLVFLPQLVQFQHPYMPFEIIALAYPNVDLIDLAMWADHLSFRALEIGWPTTISTLV